MNEEGMHLDLLAALLVLPLQLVSELVVLLAEKVRQLRRLLEHLLLVLLLRDDK